MADGTQELSFLKMHSLGNDCIIVDARSSPLAGLAPTTAGVVFACDRHFGIGADQLVLLEQSDRVGCCCRVRFFNVDGFEAGACGNATRCVAKLLMNASGGDDSVALDTAGGIVRCRTSADGRSVAVCLPPPRFEWEAIPLSIECDAQAVGGLAPPGWPPCVCVSMGNPQAVLMAPLECDLSALDMHAVAAPIEKHGLFPEGTNVMIVQCAAGTAAGTAEGSVLHVRPWERSVGETQACTTGACAAVVAASLRGLLPPPGAAAGGGAEDDVRASAECHFATRAAGRVHVVWRESGIEASCAAELAFRGKVARSAVEAR